MQNMLQQAIFFIFAGLTVLSALMVILQNNPVRSVLFLVVSFLASAALWIMVQAEFLALILILVYVGAVMTLFLFVVMMLNIDKETQSTKKMRFWPFILVIVALLSSLTLKVLPPAFYSIPAQTSATAMLSNTEALGMVLYTDYLAAFEIAAIILLVAIIAAITLVHRAPIRSKQQNVKKQIMTRREDTIKIISMNVEK